MAQNSKIGLSKIYHENSNVRLYIKCFTSLAFVPLKNVQTEFETLRKELANYNEDKLLEFVDYFEKTYLEPSSKYPPYTWNAYERVMENIELTTNAAELFHRHFLQDLSNLIPVLTHS